MEFLDIVDEHDKVIGKASKQDVYEKKLMHRIVHILLFNDRNELALQLQSRAKKFCPLHWVSSAAGHVQAGESWAEAALRELEEEIGTHPSIEFVRKDVYDIGNGLKKIIGTFRADYNGPFTVNPIEVEKVEFFTLEQIRQMIRSGEKFHPELLFLLKKQYGF